jgi:pyochelin biosynthesis protein PchC
MTGGNAFTWLRQFGAPERPTRMLVCLPHAGGAASAYRSWRNLLPDDVALYGVRYPGHQDRFAEPCHVRMAPFVEAICDAIEPLLTMPVWLFGHSMGASVAFEVAHRLEHVQGREFAGVFVSGSRAPHLVRRKGLHLGSDDDLVSYATGLGGVNSDIFDDPDLRKLALPPLRADLEILDTYERESRGPISAPLVVYMGDSDPEAGPEHVADWAALTRRNLVSRVFPGGHFYLQHQERELVEHIVSRLNSMSPFGATQ